MDISTLDYTLSYLSDTTSCIGHSVYSLNTIFSFISHHYLGSYVVTASSVMVLGGFVMGLGGLLSHDNSILFSRYGGGYGSYSGGGYRAVE